MAELFKRVWLFLIAATWWVADRLWGDAIFAEINPWIPSWITEAALRDLITWVPPLLLGVLGVVMFVSRSKTTPPRVTTTTQTIGSHGTNIYASGGTLTNVGNVYGSTAASLRDRIELRRDTKLEDALGYIETGLWGTRSRRYAPVKAIREAALEGVIKIWGRKSVNSLHVPIPAEYWEFWHISWISLKQGAPSTELAEVGSNGGQKHYDLMVSKSEVEGRWSRASFSIDLDTRDRVIEPYERLFGLSVTNNQGVELSNCLVKIRETSHDSILMGVSLPFPLRTEAQIVGQRSGEFKLRVGETKMLPVLYCRSSRRNEWLLLDERGHASPFPVDKTRSTLILIEALGGERPSRALVTVKIGEGWTAIPSIEKVPDDFTLTGRD